MFLDLRGKIKKRYRETTAMMLPVPGLSREFVKRLIEHERKFAELAAIRPGYDPTGDDIDDCLWRAKQGLSLPKDADHVSSPPDHGPERT